MKQKHIKEIVLVLVGVTLIVGGITYGLRGLRQNVIVPAETAQSETQIETIQVTVSIDGLYKGKSVAAEKHSSVLDVLEILNSENPALNLKSKSYGEMGTLVEKLGTLENGTDEKYWQYTVNGVVPMIGADVYILTNGDTLVWEFKASEF